MQNIIRVPGHNSCRERTDGHDDRHHVRQWSCRHYRDSQEPRLVFNDLCGCVLSLLFVFDCLGQGPLCTVCADALQQLEQSVPLHLYLLVRQPAHLLVFLLPPSCYADRLYVTKVSSVVKVAPLCTPSFVIGRLMLVQCKI